VKRRQAIRCLGSTSVSNGALAIAFDVVLGCASTQTVELCRAGSKRKTSLKNGALSARASLTQMTGHNPVRRKEATAAKVRMIGARAGSPYKRSSLRSAWAERSTRGVIPGPAPLQRQRSGSSRCYPGDPFRSVNIERHTELKGQRWSRPTTKHLRYLR
jgi:hypothetical protein